MKSIINTFLQYPSISMDTYHQLSVLNNKVLAEYMQSLVEFVDRYKYFDSQTRFILLTDKIMMLFKFLHGVAAVQTADEIRCVMTNSHLTEDQKKTEIEHKNTLLDGSNKIFNLVFKEITALEDFINEYGHLEIVERIRHMDFKNESEFRESLPGTGDDNHFEGLRRGRRSVPSGVTTNTTSTSSLASLD